MLFFYMCKKYSPNVFRKNCKINYFGKKVNQYNQVINFSKSCYNIQEKKLLQTPTITKICNTFKCIHSSESKSNKNNPQSVLPPLIDDVLFTSTDIFITIPSLCYLLFVKFKLDSEFNMSDFYNGCKQAILVVSHALAKENYEKLAGLMEEDLIHKLQKKISTLSEEQKRLLPVKTDDIYVLFPRNFEVVYEGKNEDQRIFAEIIMVCLSVQGLGEYKSEPLSFFHPGLSLQDFGNKVIISNYKFRKEYTNSISEPWIISWFNQGIVINGIIIDSYVQRKK